MAKKTVAKAKRINWRKRAVAAEDALLTLSERTAHLGFAYEKDKALHRRTCLENQALNIKLRRALMALYGAAENLAGRGLRASADVIGMIADDLNGPLGDTECAAIAQTTAKDE